MAAQGIFWAAAYRQAAMLDGCGLPAKVDEAEQLTDTKEHSALIAAGNGYPALTGIASGMNGIHLRDKCIESRRRGLRPGPQLSNGGCQPNINRNWRGVSIRGLQF